MTVLTINVWRFVMKRSGAIFHLFCSSQLTCEFLRTSDDSLLLGCTVLPPTFFWCNGSRVTRNLTSAPNHIPVPMNIYAVDVQVAKLMRTLSFEWTSPPSPLPTFFDRTPQITLTFHFPSIYLVKN